MKNFDLIVIGSGAGLSLVSQAIARQKKVALIESGKIGGTCLTRGCIPSKVLVYPADIIREAQFAKNVGVNFKIDKIDWDLIGKRMWAQIDESKEMEESLNQNPLLTYYKGVGEFVKDYEMKVKLQNETYSENLKGEKIIIASGARSLIPPIKGIDEAGYITNESFFGEKFPKKPWKSLIIIGGGVIAAEFAHIFSTIGTEVKIIEMLPRLVTTEEPEISDFLLNNLRRFMNVHVNTKAVAAKKKGKEKTVTCESMKTGENFEITAEEILVATGRKSNADLLKVEKTGVQTDNHGWIVTNEYLETTKKNIWCLGDANGKFQFRHKANYEVEIVQNNLYVEHEDGRIMVDYSSVPWAIYTHPQIGHVGITQAEAIEKGFKIYIAKKHYSSVAKGFAMGLDQDEYEDGFVKLIVNQDRSILGAHVIGPHAAILVQPFVYLMNAGFVCSLDLKSADDLTYSRSCPEAGSFLPIYRSQVIHPSLNEVTGWAIGSLRPVNIEHEHDHHHHDHEEH
ncbi:MAG: dihydrolipoyl dehydrogenase [Candidatus Lokiarchaeota archaeon]|nr:dihydrolipoyl dehydrogenase [Candidatus Lokiarchaeota archaeon]